jgi:hypothetical protein
MSRVTRLAALLPLLGSSCFLLPGGTEESRVEPVAERFRRKLLDVPPVPDRFAYGDPSRARVGQWARYRDRGRSVTLAAVGKEGDGVWIEEIDEGDPRQVRASLVAPDRSVRKAFYGEVHADGTRSAVEPAPLAQAAPPGRAPEAAREVGEETVRVGTRQLAARRVRLRFEDLEGKVVQETSLWHPEVPGLYAESEHGGLVRRESGGAVVELVEFGTDAQPLLEIPR